MNNKVYLYSRVSTDQQTLAQQERTVYEWLSRNNMQVDCVVSDEGVSGGVSYADRKLGKVLLPMVKAGDMIIVSEISRLGRSMFDLNLLIHKELKPRKVRLVVVSMGIDLRCDQLKAVDELILNNFSFAAQLEKQLISERTLSALQVKRQQGIRFGAANESYRKNYKRKSKEVKVEEAMKRGRTRTTRYLESKDVTAFLKVLRNIFADATNGDITEWNWQAITTKDGIRQRILSLMKDYHDLDETLFAKWDFSDIDCVTIQMKLSNYIGSIRRSALKEKLFNDN